MTRRTALLVTGLTGSLGIAFGAFGAHVLREVLSQHNTREIWNTAVLYHLVHSPVLLLLALVAEQVNAAAFSCFATGILFFSGSLYALALTDIHWLGLVTPFGGLLLMAGWVLVAVEAFHCEGPSK